MKVVQGLLISSMIFVFAGFGRAPLQETTTPPSPATGSSFDGEPWMEDSFDDILPPSNMSGDEQEHCMGVIISALNQSFGASFNRDNLLPIQMPGWDHPENGFVRGGAYNIRVGGVFPIEEARRLNIHPGRYTDPFTWLTLGDEPSLHLPGSIGGVQFFLHARTGQRDSNGNGDETIRYDFVAHVDSAYVFSPIGSLVHLFRDVIGADGRNPCPELRWGE